MSDPLASTDIRDVEGRLLASASVLGRNHARSWVLGVEEPDGSPIHPTRELIVTEAAAKVLVTTLESPTLEELVNAPMAGSLIGNALAMQQRSVRGGGRVIKLTHAGHAVAEVLRRYGYPTKTQGQMAADREADLQAARDGYNPAA